MSSKKYFLLILLLFVFVGCVQKYPSRDETPMCYQNFDAPLIKRGSLSMIAFCGKPISPPFQNFFQLSDGTIVGKLGSVYFLLKKSGNMFTAKYTVVSRGYHGITPNGKGEYTVELGSMNGLMDKNGNGGLSSAPAYPLNSWAIARMNQ